MAKRAKSKRSTSTGPKTLNPTAAKAGGKRIPTKTAQQLLRTPTGTMTRGKMTPSTNLTQINTRGSVR